MAARLARMVQSPALTIVTVLSLTVQMSGVSELKLTIVLSVFVVEALTEKVASV